MERTQPMAVLDGDLLLHHRIDDSPAWLNDYLLLAINAGLVGLSVAVFLPANRTEFDGCPAMAQMLPPCFVRLVSTPEVRGSRLAERPPWRGWTSERIAAELHSGADGGMVSLDTSDWPSLQVAEELWRAVPR